MPRPEDVNPQNFAREAILFDDGDFSVAVGIWQGDSSRRVAIRWNGIDEDHGYPSQGRYPLWFQLPEELGITFIALLVGQEHSRYRDLVQAIQLLAADM